MKYLANTLPVLAAASFIATTNAFQAPAFHARKRIATSLQVSAASGTGFGKIEEHEKNPEQRSLSSMRPDEIKELLLDLLPRMTGTSEEFKKVEDYVNALEDKFLPPQTLGFLNLAMAGEWQFLFTTNQLGRPSPLLRLTELIQKVDINGLEGKIVNQASWDWVDQGNTFDVNGNFASTLTYNINQGARMTLNDDLDLAIDLRKGSNVPSDMDKLVGLIYRAMPTEMFDASNLALDTTYVDTDLRIVRLTGVRHEGVRNIFIRKGSIEINPDL
jgi:hypothetical protein